MKKIINKNFALLAMLIATFAFAFTSCQKDSDGSPDVKSGTPVFETITPTSAAGGEMVVLKGSGLGNIVSIVFEKLNVPAFVTSTLNTETALLFRVPTDAEGGNQNITFTNDEGKTLTVPFNVLAFPQVNSVSEYNFTEGTQITLTGTNLNDVTKVVLTGTTDEATVISKTKKVMVIEMPSTTVNRATLDITNVTGMTTTTMEFVYRPNAFVVYDDAYGSGAFGGGVQSWSYSCSVSESSTEFKNGTKSLRAAYSAGGGLSLWLGSDSWSDGHWFTDFFASTYLTFWAKGDGADVVLRIVNDGPPAGYTGTATVTVPNGVWTYFKITTDRYTGSWGRVNFINDAGGQAVYFDDILFVK
jgi:hypothetical protein